MLTDERRNKKVKAFKEVADGLGCTLAQLALAWCAKNPRVSTVITGASRVEQVHENMKALDVIPLLDRRRLEEDRRDHVLLALTPR